MDLRHIALNEIDPQGLSLTVSDEEVWQAPLKEYHVSCRIVEPVIAEVFVLAQQDGCLLRGTIRGVVAMPCNRCMEETLVVLNQSFDEFEEYPGPVGTEPAAGTGRFPAQPSAIPFCGSECAADRRLRRLGLSADAGTAAGEGFPV